MTIEYYMQDEIALDVPGWSRQSRPELSQVVIVSPGREQGGDWLSRFQRQYPMIPVLQWQDNSREIQESAEFFVDKINLLPKSTLEHSQRDVVTAILIACWLTQEQQIRVKIGSQYSKGYSYTIESVYADFQTIATAAVNAGYMTRLPAHRCYQCSACESTLQWIREGCIDCHSDLVTELPLIHHFKCAYQSIADDFIETGKGLQCPKCKQTLQQVGVDHDKPGSGYRCQQCMSLHVEPQIIATCLDCGNTSEPDAKQSLTLYHYQITQMGIEKLFNLENQSSNSKMIERSLFQMTIEGLQQAGGTAQLLCFTLNEESEYGTQLNNLLLFSARLESELAAGQLMCFFRNALWVVLPGFDDNGAEAMAQKLLVISERSNEQFSDMNCKVVPLNTSISA